MSAPIESAVYKIIPAGLHKLVISLEKGNPRDSLVVEEPKPNELALYQQVRFSLKFYFLVVFTYSECLPVVGCSTSI